jgi:hypothetical protein
VSSRGAAAAEKGREAAHRMAARAAESKAKSPKVVNKAKPARGQER